MKKVKKKNGNKLKAGRFKTGWRKFLNRIKPTIAPSDWDRIITDAFREYLEEIKQMTDEEQLREIKSFLKSFAKNK